MSAAFERCCPVVLAIMAGVGATTAGLIYDVGAPPKSLAAGTMTFGVVVAGFAATQRNMLLGMGSSRVLRFAVRTKSHKEILSYLMHGVYAGLLVTLVSLIRFFLEDCNLLCTIWLGLITSGIVSVLAIMVRNEILMVRIVQRFMEEFEDHRAAK